MEQELQAMWDWAAGHIPLQAAAITVGHVTQLNLARTPEIPLLGAARHVQSDLCAHRLPGATQC